MTANRRIFLNIIATYGRSLYALVCGLITARWVYESLGRVDYGLMGLVGGLTAFIGFINSILSVSVGRYFAFSVGMARRSNNASKGLEECRQWFNTAVVLHTVVPIILMVIGYPIGEWAIRNFLQIPIERVNDCLWIFRLACVSCMWGMVAVPYNAMYGAHQYIAELTVYSFVTTTVNVFFLWYMISHPGYWLLRLAIWNFILGFIPQVIITVRAYMIFPECRLNFGYMVSYKHLMELGRYCGWYAFGMLGNLCRYQCLPILVNKYFGPAQNAAIAIANTVASHTNTLSAAVDGAFSPALTSALGAGERAKAIAFMYRTCKFGSILMLLFCIPLCIEIKEVLRLWLRTPPETTAVLAIGVMLSLFLEHLTTGHWVAISAQGRMSLYQFLIGVNFVLTLPICWVLMACGVSVYAVSYSFNITMVTAIIIRLAMVKYYFGESPKYWIANILIPILITLFVTIGIAIIPSLFLKPSFVRLLLTGVVSLVVFLPLCWAFVLNAEEKRYVCERFKKLFKSWVEK